MTTELIETAQIIEGGKMITVTRYTTPNYFIHRIGVTLAESMAGLIECDSSNTRGTAVPDEVRAFRSGWDLTKMEIENARLLRDVPSGAYEERYYLLAPHVNEIMGIPNVKTKAFGQAERFMLNKIYGLDSAKTQGYISDSDLEKISKIVVATERILEQYLGDGSGTSDTTFNTGVTVPEWKTGRLTPPVDLGTATVAEPSSAQPPAPWGDTPDTK